ncbi:hypothetical protein N9K75_02590 [bacterium]|nr:hypothetical protein [bacterium]
MMFKIITKARFDEMVNELELINKYYDKINLSLSDSEALANKYNKQISMLVDRNRQLQSEVDYLEGSLVTPRKATRYDARYEIRKCSRNGLYYWKKISSNGRGKSLMMGAQTLSNTRKAVAREIEQLNYQAIVKEVV